MSRLLTTWSGLLLALVLASQVNSPVGSTSVSPTLQAASAFSPRRYSGTDDARINQRHVVLASLDSRSISPVVDPFSINLLSALFMTGFNWLISDAARLSMVDGDVQLLRNFIAKRQSEGYSGDIIVTEFGVLGRTIAIGRKDQHVKDIFERYVQGFSTIPEVKAWAWFSDDCPYGMGRDAFDLSDLLHDTGELTPVGERFREILMQYP